MALGGITPCPPGGCGGGEPGGGGGSGGGNATRSTGISIRHLKANILGDGTLDPGNEWSVECYQDIEMSRFGSEPGENLPGGASAWDQLGMDFNSLGTELFVVSPETDSLFILDVGNNQLVLDAGEQPLQIPLGTGTVPYDIGILEAFVPDPFGDPNDLVLEDRAYVVYNGSSSMGIVDVDNRGLVANGNLLDFVGVPSGIRAETISVSDHSQSLFLVSPDSQRVLIYRLTGSGFDGENPNPAVSFVVGPSPAHVALQE